MGCGGDWHRVHCGRKNNTPWQGRRFAVTAAANKTAEAANADRYGHWHGERIASSDGDTKPLPGQLHAQVTTYHSAQYLAVRQPGGAIQDTFPVAEQEWQFCTNHRSAKIADPDSKFLLVVNGRTRWERRNNNQQVTNAATMTAA